jgi:lipopolysaccharide export system permease protein
LIKKLDTLIIRSFIGPFIATFFITLFVLVLQFFWLYIDDIVGKGLDLLTIGELMMYVAATVVPLALPLAVLLSSIMTFGNLGETFELVAIKSAGIPLLRFMRPLFFVSLLICCVAFLFHNYLIPVSNLKLNRLKYDIINKKPAFDLKEGSFYTNIPNYAIKIGKKEKDDSTLRDVIIYEKEYGLQDNIITAERGVMKVSEDKRFLEFTLYNGARNQERGPQSSMNTEYIRLHFKEFKKVFDLSALQFSETEDSLFKGNYQMLSVRQLNKALDSLHQVEAAQKKKLQIESNSYLSFVKYLDSSAPKTKVGTVPKKFSELVPDSVLGFVEERAVGQINAMKASIDMNLADLQIKEKEIRLHQMAWHEKFAMSLACIVLFLIGAPLGSIIRKGGIGTPLVFAVIFFVLFFLLNNFGKKFVKEGVMSPAGGMWLATFVLVPIGCFLTYKAMRDSQLFNKEFYFRSFKKIKPFLTRMKLLRASELES